jgi:hypothetical protein
MLLRVKDQFLPSMGTNDSHSISVSSLSHNQNISNEIESVQVPTIILMEGNHLVHGLPCFGENAFQAIKGEYKIEMPEDSAIQSPDDSALLITSWLTSEFMYLSPDLWEVRNSLRNLRAMEMQDDQGLYIVSRFPDTIANQEKWTIVFSIPQKTLEAGINNTMINSIIQNWTSRLSYYVSISQNDVQISLPAVVEF